MSGRAVSPCEHVSPSFPFPGNHLGALERQIAAAAAVHAADAMDLFAAAADAADAMDLFAAAAAAGDKRGRDPCA